MQNDMSDKKAVHLSFKFNLKSFLQWLVIAEASDFSRTFSNMSKWSFSPNLIGAYFSLSEVEKSCLYHPLTS
jgi:hypothetical protein